MRKIILKKIVSLLFLMLALSVFILFNCYVDATFYEKFASSVFYLLSLLTYLFTYPKEIQLYTEKNNKKVITLKYPIKLTGKTVVGVNSYFDIVKIAGRTGGDILKYVFADKAIRYYIVHENTFYVFEELSAKKKSSQAEEII